MNLNDIKFPNYVTGLQGDDGSWLRGGYDYQTNAPGVGYARVSLVNQVMRINLAELNYQIPETGHLVSDWFPLITFPNGYTQKIKAEQIFDIQTDIDRFIIKSSLFNDAGEEVGSIAEYGYQSYASLSTSYNPQWGNITQDDCVMDVIMSTVYYPQTDPLDGTPNLGLEILACIGFGNYGFLGINEGTFIPQLGVYSGVIANYASLGKWTDLETFSDYLHTHGRSFQGDPFTDDPIPDDPAGTDDPSGTGGGGGNYDPTSDPIDFPTLPTGGALTSGMIKGFVMNQANLMALQQKLWDMSIFDISTQFQKLVNQPLDCIISLHCLPFTPTESTAEEIKLGSFPTTINAIRVAAQYMEIDAGSITVNEFWGSALDYAPFTQVEIFVPFVGFRNLQIEDIQGLTLSMKYHVDVLTGDCVAYLKCGQSVLYSWTGNCLAHIPCTANSSDLLAKNISAIGAVGLGLATGNPASTAAGAIAGAVNTATAKNHVQRSGDVAGSPGLMSDFTPYLVFHRPKQSLAKNYNKFKGYPSNITYKLSTLQGYTEVEHVHLTGIKATDTELQEIEDLLKSGVII